ncbi:MAG: thioredoxin domain-containing protein [Syntrophales bacterium]
MAEMNRLAGEKSPYLLQHASNPVDWYPWGEEAFTRARREDRPVFLSIGYSTCHWCHVMAHESFENEEAAAMLNNAFVCIKVDREERPDLDHLYMTACQMLTGSGGWPLTVVLTPDRRPFYAATYIPRETRLGRTGLMDLVPRIVHLWQTRRQDVLQSAGRVLQALQDSGKDAPEEDLPKDILDRAYGELRDRFDPESGGFGERPKFPIPHQILFLLRYARSTRTGPALEMAERTLKAMRAGGIWDHLGFGFHRYSTDDQWHLPHFEKMLYDQALQALAYTEAFQAAGNPLYRSVAGDILTYVLRDMADPGGGFYSAEDADSEGEEGAFYVWKAQEIRRILGKQASRPFEEAYQVREEGNYLDEATGQGTGKNILHWRGDLPASLPPELEQARQALFAARDGRPRPQRDDKVLTDWNGLMLAALAKAAAAFGDVRCGEAYRRCLAFLSGTMRQNGTLLHRWRDGEAAIEAHLDDYAFLVWGLIEGYQAFLDPSLLAAAVRLQEEQDRRFWDDRLGGYFFSSAGSRDLLVRKKQIYDGAIPSGNSVSVMNLAFLSRLTGQGAHEERAVRVLRCFASSVAAMPSAYTLLMTALDFLTNPSYEIVIAGDPEAPDTAALLTVVRERYLPGGTILVRPPGRGAGEIGKLAPFVKDMKPVGGKAAAYVCRHFSCRHPVTDPEALREALEEEHP